MKVTTYAEVVIALGDRLSAAIQFEAGLYDRDPASLPAVTRAALHENKVTPEYWQWLFDEFEKHTKGTLT